MWVVQLMRNSGPKLTWGLESPVFFGEFYAFLCYKGSVPSFMMQIKYFILRIWHALFLKYYNILLGVKLIIIIAIQHDPEVNDIQIIFLGEGEVYYFLFSVCVWCPRCLCEIYLFSLKISVKTLCERVTSATMPYSVVVIMVCWHKSRWTKKGN